MKGMKIKNALSRLALHRWGVYAILALLCVLIYGRTVYFDYALDDAIVIYENAFTKKGIKGLVDIFTHDSFYGFFGEDKSDLVSGGRYRPLSIAMFAVEYELFGRSPAVGHLINVLVYFVLCVLLYHFIRAFSQAVGYEMVRAGAMGLVGAVVFALHPVHVEVVSNIKGRDELLALLASLATLYAVLQYHRTGRGIYLLVMAVMYFLALLSKEISVVVLPWALVVMYLLGSTRRVMMKVVGVLGLAFVVYLVLRLAVVGWGMGKPPMEMMNNPFIKVVDGRYVLMTPWERMASILYVMWEYARLSWFPLVLTHDYYPRYIPVVGVDDWRVWAGVLWIGVLFVGLAYFLRKRHLMALAVALYVLPLVIVGNVFFPIGTHMGERFLFFSSAGIAFAVGWMYEIFGGRWKNWLRAAVLLWAVFLLWRSVARVPVWKDDFTLFTHDVRISKNSAKANNAAAGALITRALKMEESPQRDSMLRRALFYTDRALHIHPAYASAHYLRGLALYGLKRYDASIEALRTAISYKMHDREFRDALYSILLEAGKEMGEKRNDPEAAMRYFLEAEKLRNDDAELYRLMGVAMGVMGQYRKSIQYFRRALALDATQAELYKNLGISYRFLNMLDSSEYYFMEYQRRTNK